MGILTLVLFANYAMGWAWDAATGGPSGTAVAAPEQSAVGGPPTHPGPAGAVPRNVLADSPAMRDSPWADAFYAEFAYAQVLPWPYTLDRLPDFEGRFITFRDGARVSFQPPSGQPMPLMVFHGGSTMWGENQRNEWTITSWVARLALADHLPVRVANRGVRGDHAWSELLSFEAELHDGTEHPDFAVFYDGWNECATQTTAPAPGQPSDFNVSGLRLALEPTAERSLVGAYAQHSFVHHLARGLHGLLATEAAEAGPMSTDEGRGDVRRCAAVYRRARDLIGDVARSGAVVPVFFWQPVGVQSDLYDAAGRRVGSPTIDLGRALDGHREVYVDEGHTNEEGARLVAVAMWTHLRPLVEQWYRNHPRAGP